MATEGLGPAAGASTSAGERPSSAMQDEAPRRQSGCLAEELADARLLSRSEALAVIESLTEEFLEAISRGDDPELHLVGTFKASSPLALLLAR